MALHAFLFLGVSLAVITGGMESDIIGGEVAIPHSRPYMASIQIRRHHTCGGMLIKKNYVLTAAHCLDDLSINDDFEVVLGAHDLRSEETSQQRIPVKRKIQHPDFKRNDMETYRYDIMLLKLENKAKPTDFVKVMPLPEKNETTTDVQCSIAGWGSITANGKEASHVMREVNLKLEENSRCKHQWQKYFDSERMICSVSDGIHAFCQGDSGGPLICNDTPQGITSYTFGGDCTNTTYPQVYVKIFSFLKWIKKHMK